MDQRFYVLIQLNDYTELASINAWQCSTYKTIWTWVMLPKTNRILTDKEPALLYSKWIPAFRNGLWLWKLSDIQPNNNQSVSNQINLHCYWIWMNQTEQCISLIASYRFVSII